MAERLPDFPIISHQELAVLDYLTEVWPTACPQIEVAAGAGFKTRRTAKRHLDGLVTLHLAAYDRRARGYCVTQLGRAFLGHT